MNPKWPNQERVVAEVKAFAKREGFVTKRGAIDEAAVAGAFDLEKTTFHQMMSNKNRPEPALSTLKRMAARMGVDPSVLVAPGRPGFIPEEDWSVMGEATKAAWDAIYQNLKHTKPEELLIIAGMVAKAQEIGRARSADEHININ